MSGPRHVVGIDLGTTHTALAAAPVDDEAAAAAVERIAQLVTTTTVEERPLLPSCVYFAHETEAALAIPWDRTRRHAVGEYARSRGAEAPQRVVASAKSWLSHQGIDRRADLLPLGAPPDVEKISPVQATWHYLDHLAESWGTRHPGAPLAEQEIVITVPASFDAAARDLTVEAAYAAGLENTSLLEEPQAALYAWIATHGTDWRKHLSVGDVILVVDLGGGTTDFSAIAVREEDGSLELRRIAVGDHILLGGDNMDLALAHLVSRKLAAEGTELDRWQLTALTHGCRNAKEKLLAQPDLGSVPVVVPGRGSQLLDGARRSELTRAEVEAALIEGFFPRVAATARPGGRQRAALTQLGLPYAADAGITRHLAAFLTRQAAAAAELGAPAGTLLRPTHVLFNGGVTKAPAFRDRLLAILNDWLANDGAPPVKVLPGEDPDLAVARGAAYFALVRRGRGLRIRGGTARAYYVGIESPMPAVPGMETPVNALCVAAFGVEEGSPAEILPQELCAVVGESVRFRFFASSVRRADRAGTELERWGADELEELAPIEVTLPAEGRTDGDLVPVHLASSVTAIGTLLLEAVPLEPAKPDERWKVELGVRGDTEEV
ncbi:MAG: Hsp70 family protein [Polyangiaceae bacterium]|nr:Hsp70 family protein [Polyangiaceae bacterium]